MPCGVTAIACKWSCASHVPGHQGPTLKTRRKLGRVNFAKTSGTTINDSLLVKQTPLDRSQQLPAPYERLINGLKQN